ncbi:MAG: ABC transporter substrate-binding protein [Eubacteriales bacterium]|nr:ABC transporter substrate-binding protein [Eubacteriales bacterium]
MAKKYIAFFMAIAMLFTCLAGCTASQSDNDNAQEVTEQPTAKITDSTTFKLSYTKGDSLDPFKAKTQNNQVLATLVFESLFDLDESYEPVNNIATGYEFVDGKTLKVDISPNIKFSDGSSLDTSDVAYSFRAAKKSPAYKNSLQYIDSVSEDSGSVIFYLDRENPYAVNLLTFPIASTEDDKEGYPVGSGRYKYETSDGKTVLTANVSDSFDPYITTVNLVNIAAADSIDNAVNIGNISYAFRDLSSSVSKRMSCAKKLVNMNNLVYIGVNSKSGITANEQIRRAISLAADRSTFADSAYSGYATVASSPFNPSGKIAENIKIFSDEADIATAKQAIAQSGEKAKDLKLTILVNKNNNRTAVAALLKSQLEAVGFTVDIETLSAKEYTAKIKAVDFDIYIGEVKLSDDMSLYPFFDEKGGTRYGIDRKNIKCDDIYANYLSGKSDLGSFILSFNEELPFIPLVYKKGMICYSKAMNGDMQGYYGNFFSNIDTWNFIS